MSKAEITLAVSEAILSSISAIDHLTDIVKSCGSKSPLGEIHLKRTKTTMIVNNVVATSLREELIKA